MDWKKYFKYCSDGSLERLNVVNQHTHVGSVNSEGYIQFELKNKTYMLHRVVWEYHNGAIPIGLLVDHIDRNPLNNRIENLRLCTPAESKINTGLNKNNTSGYKGVLKTPSGKYQARLGFGGKKLYLGLFNSAEEAAECVREATKELYGEFTAL